jgi:hypothetical protein
MMIWSLKPISEQERYCMKRMHRRRFSFAQPIVRGLLALIVLLPWIQSSAQTTVSSDPANLASGVSPSAAVVFTFSGPMSTASVNVQFYTVSPFGFYPVSSSWNNANDILTCTPTSPFPGNASVSWVVSGMDANNMQVIGQGSFTTGTNSGGGITGYGTNQISSFYLGKLYVYGQGLSGPPVPKATAPFIFNGTTTLASNRTATSITLTLPNAAVSNFTQNLVAKENYYLTYFNTSSNAVETNFPSGDYTFTVNAAASNQTVVVTFPASMVQPDAPYITNLAAAQAVDVSKPFTLWWKPFAGGSSSDFILVTVGNWMSPPYGATNALNGTSTSVTIPAGTLQANSNYTAGVGFEHAIWSTNSAYASGVYRATVTSFTLNTIAGSSAPPPVLGNPGWSGNAFGFDVDTVSGQKLTVVYSTDCSLPLSHWPTLITTNSPGSKVHISHPNASLMPITYYSVRNGP